MKVRAVFAKDTVGNDAHPAEHLFVITEDGRLFERFSDDEPGRWSQVPLPEVRNTRQAKRNRQKR